MNHRSFWLFMASNFLFYLGHFASKVMNTVEGRFGTYRIYNWLMVKSYQLDKECRVWKEPKQEDTP